MRNRVNHVNERIAYLRRVLTLPVMNEHARRSVERELAHFGSIQAALERSCPACGAAPGAWCVRPNGQETLTLHTARNKD